MAVKVLHNPVRKVVAWHGGKWQSRIVEFGCVKVSYGSLGAVRCDLMRRDAERFGSQGSVRNDLTRNAAVTKGSLGCASIAV